MACGLSSEEIEWIREGYRMFREGDPAFLDRAAPDARYEFPATLPSGGVYESPFDALEYFTTVGELFEAPNPDPEEFVRVEDRLIVFGTFRARSSKTGEEIATRFVHSYRLSGGDGPVSDQKVVSFEVFIDTAAVLGSLGI
jgi:ketosteroid isomerase-like protein